MKFAAMFAAFVSVFALTSCLDDGESSPQQFQSLVTMESSYMGNTVMYADEYPATALVPTNTDLNQFGITSSTKRAMVVYTIPEGQDMTAKQVNVTVTNGQAWPVYNISNMPDTCEAYKDPIIGFSDFAITWTFKSGFIARDRYMNVGYKYRPNTKAAYTVMLPNRVSNDTLYLDFKMKKLETAEGQERIFMNTYDLMTLNPMFLMNLVPKQDSIYVTVVSDVAQFGGSTAEKKDSVTNRCRFMF